MNCSSNTVSSSVCIWINERLTTVSPRAVYCCSISYGRVVSYRTGTPTVYTRTPWLTLFCTLQMLLRTFDGFIRDQRCCFISFSGSIWYDDSVDQFDQTRHVAIHGSLLFETNKDIIMLCLIKPPRWPTVQKQGIIFVTVVLSNMRVPIGGPLKPSLSRIVSENPKCLTHNISKAMRDRWFQTQRTTYMNLHIASPMITWPMTPRDPERSRSWPQYLWSIISQPDRQWRSSSFRDVDITCYI